jgi:DNA invertase Pin-like site-specific DNA recombinase
MKRAALYCRVSTVDQHPETQLGELRQFAANKGFQVVGEYTDHGFSGTKARRPELDRMMDDARTATQIPRFRLKQNSAGWRLMPNENTKRNLGDSQSTSPTETIE